MISGQWIGTQFVINIDETKTGFHGVIFRHWQRPRYFVPFSDFDFSGTDTPLLIHTSPVKIFDLPDRFQPSTARYGDSQLHEAELRHDKQTAVLEWDEDLTFFLEEDTLTISDKNGSWTDRMTRSCADAPSRLISERCSWSEYKSFVFSLETNHSLFRGQHRPWRLRTSFHRRGRADVERFLNHDVPALHRRLSASTRHVFDLKNPDEASAFYNLVQHYGYPTPLLDWTYSPYIAAFFAYRGFSNDFAAKTTTEDVVRIFMFNQEQWTADFGGWEDVGTLAFPRLHLSVGNFIAIENERLTPQQAASTLTNIDDIETFVQQKESEFGKSYLRAFDIPISERRAVVRDLRYMGITAGSLFPGLDGACEELAERNFEI